MKKQRKTISQKKNLMGRYPLRWLTVLIVIALGISTFAAIRSGTGPLAFLANPISINKLEPEEDCYLKSLKDDRYSWNGARCVFKSTANPGSPGGQTVQSRDEINCEAKGWDWNKNTKKCNAPSRPAPPDPPTPPTSTTCPGNIPVKEGQTVSSGKPFEGDLNQRECVTCQNGRYVNPRACSEAVKKDPQTTVLPVAAGYQYTGGTKEEPVKVPRACIDSLSSNAGNTASGNTNSKGEYCMDGQWIPADNPATTGDEQLQKITELSRQFCTNPAKPEWNKTTGQCGPHIPTAVEIAQANAIKVAAQQRACDNQGRPFLGLDIGCGCKAQEVMRGNSCVQAPACTTAGKGTGGCKSDETCVQVEYGFKYCQATSTISPVTRAGKPLTTFCENNVFSTWNQDTGSYDKSYCQYGCTDSACYKTPTTAITYPTEDLCNTNRAATDTCTLLPYSTSYTRVKNPNPPSTPQNALTNPPPKLVVTNKNAGLECDGTSAYLGADGKYYDDYNKTRVGIPSCDQLCGGLGSRAEGGKTVCDTPPIKALAQSEREKASLKAGQVCSSGSNNACESNDCRYFTAPDGETNWYCMVAGSAEKNVSPDGWKRYVTINGQQKTYNNSRCSAHDQCLSGFCSGLGTLSINECKDNPFATTMAPSSNSTTNNVPPTREQLADTYSQSECSKILTDRGWTATHVCTKLIGDSYSLTTKSSSGNSQDLQNTGQPQGGGSFTSGDGTTNTGAGTQAPPQPAFVVNTTFTPPPACSDSDLTKAIANQEFCWMKNDKPVFTKMTEIGVGTTIPVLPPSITQGSTLNFTCPKPVADSTGFQLNDTIIVPLQSGETITGRISQVSNNGNCGTFNIEGGSSALGDFIFDCLSDPVATLVPTTFTRTVPAGSSNSSMVAGCTLEK